MGKNILVAEDDRNIAKLIKEIIERKGNSAAVAIDGEQAFQLYSSIKFDLIITDLKMPKIDGMNLVKMVREKNPNIPIIIITAYGSEKNRALAESLGVTKILSKPCSILEITQAIETSLSRG
jgi:DNA-binding response OmpR family regulator